MATAARQVYSWLLVVCVACAGVVIHGGSAYGGSYLSSAHGNNSYGVSVPAKAAAGYARGNCANCHEQHGSIAGATQGLHNFLLFAKNKNSQTVNVCFNCHTYQSSLQQGGSIINRDYTYRAGGCIKYSQQSVLQNFRYSGRLGYGTASAHDLEDISTFIATQTQWGYTDKSNPCTACHDPHAAQGDPAHAPNSFTSPTTRGWPLSRPSRHNKVPPQLWGTDTSQRMSSVGVYQAPYRFGSTAAYEPDGSATENGSNLTDYDTFCTDCHNTTNSIYSTVLGRFLKKIDWSSSGDIHGGRDADSPRHLLPPYTNTPGYSYILSCLDCHEPHGSWNSYLLRREVNGRLLQRDLNGTITVGFVDSGSATAYGPDITFGYLCRNCHKDDGYAPRGMAVNGWTWVHMASYQVPQAPYEGPCLYCHPQKPPGQYGETPIPCINCHYHGATPAITPVIAPFSRHTF